MNKIGNKVHNEHPLSSSWYKKANIEQLKRIRASCTSFFERVSKTPSKNNGWTTFANARASVKGKGYARGWIPSNTKATNDYADKQSMAYLCNWFLNPIIKRYFEERGVMVNEEAYALSAMLQWIWRSRIRRNEPIHVFIPSERMRSLLKDWLAGTGVSVAVNQPSSLAA